MAKLPDCQFIEIEIDNKKIAGSSEEEKYKGWMEGYSSLGLSTYSGPDGTYFESGSASIQVTKDTSELYSKYLKRGYKEIIITIVHRGSDHANPDYEIQRTVYKDCKINSLNFDMRDRLFMNITFTCEKEITVTFEVPDGTDNGLDKIGPMTYNIPEKNTLKF